MPTMLLKRFFICRCTAVAVLCLAHCVVLCQQPYTPLVQEDATWILAYSPDDFVDYYYYAYRIEGDTTLNNVTYKKVFFYELEPNQRDPFVILNKEFAAVVREDTELKYVYGALYNFMEFTIWAEDCFWEPVVSPDEETLLLDFSKTVGDTVLNCHLDDNQYEMGSVIMEDTTLDRYGQERRVLIDTNELELIEGVGYEKGLFLLANTLISAAWGYGLVDFCIGAPIDCHLTTSTGEVPAEVDVQVFPNPASHEIHVISTERIEEIQLFDPLGRQVMTTQTATLDLDRTLSSGLYGLRVVLQGGGTGLHKIIIQNN